MRSNKITWAGLFGGGALLAVTFAGPASATKIDPLHGTCSYAAPSCVDNGTITPIFNNNTPTFGFDKSPNTGNFTNFYLQVLIPNNVAGGNGLSFSMNGTNTGNSSASSSLFSSTAWTSGDLTGYLGISGNLINGAPPNPLNAWLPSTQGVDAGATGYFVYTLDFGAVTFGALTDPQFTDSFHLPNGTVIVADVYGTQCHGKKCETGYITTAQSAALLIAGTPKQVPEPVTISLFGVGLLGMGALSRRRKARKAA